MADFCLVSRRVLDEQDHRLFRYYFLFRSFLQAVSSGFPVLPGVVEGVFPFVPVICLV